MLKSLKKCNYVLTAKISCLTKYNMKTSKCGPCSFKKTKALNIVET